MTDINHEESKAEVEKQLKKMEKNGLLRIVNRSGDKVSIKFNPLIMISKLNLLLPIFFPQNLQGLDDTTLMYALHALAVNDFKEKLLHDKVKKLSIMKVEKPQDNSCEVTYSVKLNNKSQLYKFSTKFEDVKGLLTCMDIYIDLNHSEITENGIQLQLKEGGEEQLIASGYDFGLEIFYIDNSFYYMHVK